MSVPGRQASALTLSVLHDGTSTALPLVIKATKGMTAFRYSSPVEVQDHLKAVESLRGSNRAVEPPPAPAAIAEKPERPLRRTLERGMSSATMNLVGLIAFGIGALAFLAMLPFGILTWTHIWDVPVSVFLPLLYVGLAGIGAGRILWIFVPTRERAELRAGYTLSNDGDLSVDQLDPRTGYVIRPAGSPALDRQTAKSERLRVRGLADATAPGNHP